MVESGHRCVARGHGEPVRRGGSRRLALRSLRLRRRRLGCPHQRRGDGEHHGPHDRQGRAPGRAPRRRATPRRSARGRPVYASDQTHFSIERGVDLLGFPEGTLEIVPSDEAFRLRASDVEAAVSQDRAAGLTPFAICAVAGSTNTGSIDDVPGLADLAEREGLWLHVDAAYGAAARISPREAQKLPALERADSLTIDPHKWLFQPYDIGGLLVKRREISCTRSTESPSTTRSGVPRRGRCIGTSTRWKGRGGSAPSSSGCRGSTSGPTASRA